MSDLFRDPPPEYRGTELYMLNDKLEGKELERQIGEMKKQGFYSFIARTYIGLKSDYPGRDFHDRIADIIGACKKYDMKVFLQAGYMPGGVADLPDPYAHTGLRAVQAAEGGGKVLQSRKGIDYTLMIQPNFLDMLSKDAVAYYIKKSYEEMWDEFKDEFGKTVVSVWVDEPHFRPPDLPWTPELPDCFRNLWGYDIREKLYLLYDEEDGCQTLRYQYWRTVLHLLQEAYFKGISGWCHKNGLMFSGHLMGEDTLFHQISLTCDCMPLYKYFDIPGIDYLTSDLDWRHGMHKGQKDNYLFVNTPLQCVSAAHQAGSGQILCEMFGVSKQNLTFADQRYLFDFFASFGVNHKMAHGVFYSLRGRSKRAYPPHINYYQPYWENYHLVNDYFARVSWFISQGEPTADVLVLHPVETAFSRYDSLAGKKNPFDDRDRGFNELLQRLLAVHVSFELGDEETIAQWGSAENGRFVIGKMAYRTVVLPDLGVLRESTLVLLEKFTAQGGKVIVMGKAPCLLDGSPFDPGRLMALPGLEKAASDVELAGFLLERENKPYQFTCAGDGSSVFINLRKDEKGYNLFAYNMDRTGGRDIEITVPGRFGAQLLAGESGERYPWPVKIEADSTTLGCSLEKGSSVMLRLDKESMPVTGEKALRRNVISVTEGFHVKRKAPNVLTLDTARFRRAKDPWSAPYPVLAIHHVLKEEAYAGEISLAFSIRCSKALTGLSLALEESDQVRAELNGVPVDMKASGYYYAKCFETISLPDVMKQGDNTLVLSRRFVSPAKPETNYSALYENLGGVELESVYLLGDFQVNAVPEKTSTGCIRLSPLFTLDEEKEAPCVELVSHGYPFYAGTVELSNTLILPEAPEGRAELYLEGFHGCNARIRVNGKDGGLLAWPPYRADVSGLMKSGENHVVIELTNSLRNLLGPYHRPEGEPGHCWGNYASPDGPWMGDFEFDPAQGRREKWYDHRSPDNFRWTDSYLQTPFGLSGFRIEYF